MMLMFRMHQTTHQERAESGRTFPHPVIYHSIGTDIGKGGPDSILFVLKVQRAGSERGGK